jgi:DNA-binding MarR family transcriptional regulator
MDAHETRLYFYLQRTATDLKMAADRAMKELAGITTSQAAVLAVIKGRGPIRQKTLADMLQHKEAAVTQMISKLEHRGLVARRRAAKDQRAWDVEITQKGLDVLSMAEPAFGQINALLDTALGTGQLEFVDQLLAVRQALQTL